MILASGIRYFPIIIPLFLIYCFIIVPVMVSDFYKVNIKKLYSLKIYDNYFCNTTIVVNDEGIATLTNICEVYYKWNALKKIYVVDGNVFIETFMRDFIFLARDSLNEILCKEIVDKIKTNTGIQVTTMMPSIIFA